MRSVLGKALMLGLAVAATSIAGCSSDAKPPTSGNSTGATGDIGLQLQIGGTTVNTVHYVIDNGTNHYEGDLSVGDASHLLAVIGGIQAGSGYVLTLSATGTNGTPCAGASAPFAVIANSTVIVGIQLLCRPGSDAGSVKIEGTVAECANIGSVSAAVPNGNTIQISTTTVPASPNPPVVFSWAGDVAGLSSTTSPNPVYTCNNPGTTDQQINLDLTISQGSTTVCNKLFHLIIDCPPGTAGTTTTTGTGGTGGATGGTGGTGGGGAAGTGGTGGTGGGEVDAGTGGAGGATGGAGGATGGAAGATGGAAGATGGAAGATGGAGGSGGNPSGCKDTDCYACITDESGNPDPCVGLTGTATAGPGAGVDRAVLCRETLDCFRQSACHSNAVYECYCGTAIDQGTCGTSTNIPMPGACKTQMDRSLEIPAGSAGGVALGRLTDGTFAGGQAGITATFENSSCPTTCFPYTCQ